MRYQELGNTGMHVSILACGSNALRGYSYEEAKVAYNRALDSGVNFIETGRPYGDETEDRIGKAVSHRRDEFYLASKTVLKTAQEVRREVDTSLKILQTDYLDLYSVAAVDNKDSLEQIMGPGGAIEGLEKIKEEGKIGHIGLTGHRPEILADSIQTGRVEALLFVFNMVYREPLDELIPLAKENKIGTMVMRPLSHGELKPVSKALAYVLTSGVDTSLCGMYSIAEVDENVAVANTNFTPEEIKSLQEEADALPNNGCCNCGKCSCPQKIDIPYLLKMTPYRDRYGLLPAGEKRWQSQAEVAKRCDECGKCESDCPYDLSIITVIEEIATRV
ncbi:MAG: aldo/keto reductase [Candidatus Poribacteria bacterium]